MPLEGIDSTKLPKHVAIIMDGNGRWAKGRHLPRTQGHLEGVKRAEEITKAAREFGIKVLTLYTFSTENWTRPSDEVGMLMRTFISVLNQKVKELNEAHIRLQFLGRRENIPKDVLKVMDQARAITKNNEEMVLNMAFNYGSRSEIVDAVTQIAHDVQEGRLKVGDIKEETISRALYTQGLPDPDLLIRTSGEKRISNFLLWQLSYAELYFTDKYWPDFHKEEFKKALMDYSERSRRYGNIA